MKTPGGELEEYSFISGFNRELKILVSKIVKSHKKSLTLGLLINLLPAIPLRKLRCYSGRCERQFVFHHKPDEEG